MSNLSAFDALAKIVGEALSPIAIRLQGDQAELMMEQLGVRLPLSASGVTVGLQSAALTCSELPAVVAAVNDATTQGDNDALVVALRNLSEVLVRASTVFVQLGRALDTVIQGDDSLSAQQKVRLHNVVKKFDARLLHLALISYIEERQPAVKGALEVAGLFDDTLIESDSTDPSLPVHHLKSVRFDRIPPLFSNPVQHLNTLYGFGNHDFNGLELFRRIKQMVDRPDSEAVIIQAPGLPAILEAWQFRMEVVPGAIPALRIRLRMSAQKDLDISEHLGGPWVGTVISSARFDNGIELLLHPTQGLRIEPPHSNVSIDLALGVKAENQNNSPMILFGEVGNNRVEVQRFALHLPIKLITASGLPSSSSEVSVAFEMRGGRIKIDESQADGFLAEILPKGGATIPFDLEGRWSVDRGLSFRGGAGLEVTLPVKADLFGVINIDSVYLALEVRGDSERNDSGIRAVTATTAKVTLGPVSAVVEHFGLQASLSFPDSGGNLGVAALDFGFKPPTGVGLTVNGPGVRCRGG